MCGLKPDCHSHACPTVPHKDGSQFTGPDTCMEWSPWPSSGPLAAASPARPLLPCSAAGGLTEDAEAGAPTQSAGANAVADSSRPDGGAGGRRVVWERPPRSLYLAAGLTQAELEWLAGAARQHIQRVQELEP